MKIVLVQAGLSAGGAEKIVNLLAGHFAGKGHQVTVLSLAGMPDHSYFTYGSEIRVESFQTGNTNNRGLSARLANIRWLRGKFREIRPDLVISFLTKVNLFASIAARSAGVPVIVSERNNPNLQHAKSPWRFANRITGLLANRMVMQTRQAADSLPQYSRRRAVVIANPHTYWGSTPVLPQDPPAFVATGRLDRQKGFDMLLDAFGQVAAAVPEAMLTIFGDGPEKQNLSDQVNRMGLEGCVQLAGRTEKPGDWIKSGNLFVLSSRFEGFPNVLVEAMSAGFAVVAFDCAWGPGELVSDRSNGLLVENASVEKLAEAMKELATDADLRARLSSLAPQAVESLSQDAIFAKWDDLISAYDPLSTNTGRK